MEFTLEEVLESLDDALNRASALNRDGEPTRSRQLSLVVTKLEEARHWLSEALDKPCGQ